MKIKTPLTFLLVLIYIFVLYFSPPRYINKPKFLFLKAFRFPLHATQKLAREIRSIFKSRHAVNENIVLYDTISVLTQQLVYYRDIEEENERLRSMLGFKQRSSLKLIPAFVVSRDSSNLSDTIVIDYAKDKNIKKDTVVVSQAGLVGRVIDSSPGMSRVLLLTDRNFRVSAITLQSRQLGVVYGALSGTCKMVYLSLDSEIQEGDPVLTSGFSDVYPKGLLIGTISKVIKEPRGLSLSAIIKPAVDFSRLEEVLCIE